MKKLGLVGGMGPESTLVYYQGIVQGVRAKSGRDAFPPLTIESVDVYRVLGYCAKQQYTELKRYLLSALQNLSAAGADFAALAANTPHIVFDELEKESPLPLTSIVTATQKEASRRQLKKIGLLGTIFTMTGAFFKKPFADNGIKIITPTPSEMEVVNEKIAHELELGIVKPDTLALFQMIIQRMQNEDQIQALVLGCTELPLLLNEQTAGLPCLDTLQIHIRELVDSIIL
jgi:aspartate racemase